MPSRGTVWGTKLGFYLAAIGTAFGLGNLWRFPYVVAENGGGAFVLLYLMLAFLIGMPFLIGELSLGKISRSSVSVATWRIGQDWSTLNNEGLPRPLRWLLARTGGISVIITLFILAYYAVISSWVLYFLIDCIKIFLTGSSSPLETSMGVLMQNGWLQILLTFVHLTIVAFVVAKGLEQGVETWLGYSMPLFGTLVIVLAYSSLSLDSSVDAIRFLLYPDFSKLRAASLGQALGHVLFTLSVGFGTMVTFGSYLRDRASLPSAGFRVTVLDCVISLMAGILIFPLVTMSRVEDAGPGLLFRAVPRLLGQIPSGNLFGIGFFLCLYLASLGASIGLLETIVANLRQSRRVHRQKAAWLALVTALVMAVVPAFSTNTLRFVQFNGHSLLEICDSVLINWALPIVALLISQVVAWQVQESLKRAEFPEDQSGALLYSHWIFALKYLAPPIILLALALQVIGILTIS